MLAFVCVSSYAQVTKNENQEHRKELHEKRANLTPEQMAELSTKKMTLHLDLNESQQAAIEKLELEKAKQKKAFHQKRKSGKELSENDRFESKIARLDSKIAYKKKMSSILNAEQYKKWEKGSFSKKRKHRKNHSKREFSSEKQEN